jgi:hypothetical protein
MAGLAAVDAGDIDQAIDAAVLFKNGFGEAFDLLAVGHVAGDADGRDLCARGELGGGFGGTFGRAAGDDDGGAALGEALGDGEAECRAVPPETRTTCSATEKRLGMGLNGLLNQLSRRRICASSSCQRRGNRWGWVRRLCRWRPTSQPRMRRGDEADAFLRVVAVAHGGVKNAAFAIVDGEDHRLVAAGAAFGGVGECGGEDVHIGGGPTELVVELVVHVEPFAGHTLGDGVVGVADDDLKGVLAAVVAAAALESSRTELPALSR